MNNASGIWQMLRVQNASADKEDKAWNWSKEEEESNLVRVSFSVLVICFTYAALNLNEWHLKTSTVYVNIVDAFLVNILCLWLLNQASYSEVCP